MFDSKIKARDLITLLQNEVDVAPDVPNESYLTWLSQLEQLLYTEFIKEQGAICVEKPIGGRINLAELPVPAEESSVRFEDIHTVYADKCQLIKSTLTSGVIFPNTFYKVGDQLGYSSEDVHELKIIYFVKPAIKTEDSTVKLPFEFIEMAKAKLRGEAFKVADENAFAAKWLNEYNTQLQDFLLWLQSRQPSFGM